MSPRRAAPYANPAQNDPKNHMKGVTDDDARHREKSLNIKTIRDLATNKFS